MYNGNYKVASLVYIYNVYVCSKTIFSPVDIIALVRFILRIFIQRFNAIHNITNSYYLYYLFHISYSSNV